MTVLQPLGVAGGDAAGAADAPVMRLDLVGLFQNAAWPVKITIGLLIGCSLLVWIIAALKLMQLGRLRSVEGEFERRARRAASAIPMSPDVAARPLTQ